MRPTPVVLAIVIASAVVAIGATGVGLLSPAAALTGSWSWWVRVAGATAAAAGIAGLLVQRKRLRSRSDRRYDPAVAAVLTAATIMGALALVAVLAPGEDAPREEVVRDGGVIEDEPRPPGDAPQLPPSGISGGFGAAIAGPGTAERIDVEASRRGGDDSSWRLSRDTTRRILLVIVLAFATFLVLRALVNRLRSRRAETPATPVAPEQVDAAIEASLDEIAREGEAPAAQIVAAYRRLLAELSAAGAPRRPQEAPHEHLYRVLGALAIDAVPMHRLTALYVAAQFAERPVTEGDRAAAAGAFESALAGLRATGRSRAPIAAGPVPAGTRA